MFSRSCSPNWTTFFSWQLGQVSDHRETPGPSATAGKGQQILMVTVGAANTGESLRQVTTPEIVPNHMGDYLPIETVALCKTLWIDILKVIETLHKQFIE